MKTLKTHLSLAALATALLAPLAASAAVLQFTGPSGPTAQPLVVGPATITTPGNSLFVFAPGPLYVYTNGGFCSLNNGSCEGDATLTFSYAVTNLSFRADGFDAGDSALVTAFNGSDVVGTQSILQDAVFSFGNLVITSLFFDDSSTGRGFSYGDFAFDVAGDVPEAPEPGALGLLAVGLMGAAFARRRRPA
jgi:hypothetical protein